MINKNENIKRIELKLGKNDRLDSLINQLEEKSLQIYQRMKYKLNEIDPAIMTEFLSKIIGQQDSIERIIEQFQSWFASKEKKAPLSFFLVGPSGVGKTETVNLFAESLQKYKYGLKTFNMNEYDTKEDENKLKGAPPGYEGNPEPPALLTAIQQNKKHVLLFDEIEKADKSILILLMQILERGSFSFNVKGKEIEKDFTDCIIFFTSNANMGDMIKTKEAFLQRKVTVKSAEFKNKIAQILIDADLIKPELERRVSDFLVYNYYDPESTIRIILKMLHITAEEYNYNLKDIDAQFLAEAASETMNSSKNISAINKFIETNIKNNFAEKRKREYQTVSIIRTENNYDLKTVEDDLKINEQEMVNSALEIYKKQKNRLSVLNKDKLRKNLDIIMGQNDNITLLVNKLYVWYATINKSKPVSFFFVGPSGTGKTFTAEKLKDALTPYGYGFYKKNGTDLKSESEMSTIVGMPPGWKDSKKEPDLFKSLKRFNGKLVILFDEVEKAYTAFLTRIMQLLEKGELNWGRGSGNFSNCVILFTSNYRMQDFIKLKQDALRNHKNTDDIAFQSEIFDLLKLWLPQELERRIDLFLVYNNLQAEQLVSIAMKELNKIAVENYNIEPIVYVAPEFIVECVKAALQSQDQGIGAIQKILYSKVAEGLIENNINGVKSVSIIKKNYQWSVVDSTSIQIEGQTGFLEKSIEILKSKTQKTFNN